MIENIILGSKLRRWNRLFCMRIKLLLLSKTILPVLFQAIRIGSTLTCCNYYNILLFEEQMWPLLQLSIFKFINLVVKRTSTSIKGQALFRNIKPTMYFGASFHILYHSIMVLICWKTFLYFKLIHIGVKIQSQLRSMVFVDSSIVHTIILTWLGNGDILYLLPGILTKVNISLCNLFSWN